MNLQRHCINWLRRVLALILVGVLCTCSFPGMVPQAHAEQSGMVRVKLTRLGTRSSLTMSPTCAYKAGSVSISSGTPVTVSASGGKLTMTVGGKSYGMGEKMTLARQGSGMTGLKFSDPSMSNVFCGDLVLYASGSSITPVLHMYIEDYLYGVVAYEMSNSWPLEALKTQAVAARNYAIIMANSRKSQTYDVTDNTNSQVYKGYNSSYSKVIQAVNETAGYLLYSGSSLAKCYYAASNGGQTDSTKNVWGGSLSYSVVKNDPYDLEATAARARSTTIPRYPTASNPLNSTLRSWLISGIESDIYKADVTASTVSIEEITSITPHTPKYAAPSILYKKLKFTMRCTGKNSSGNSVEFTASCDINTYGGIESLFGLSINSGSNETVMVTQSGSAYTITFRRYGHGVGMSQHGARIMALNYGKSYKDILEFYYPGTTLKKVSLSNTVGKTNINDGVTETGVSFVAGDSVKVSLSGADSTLNLRAQASATSTLLGKIPNGTVLKLQSVSDGWGKVTYDGMTGYILLAYTKITDDAPDATATPEATASPDAMNAVVKLSSSSKLNVRKSASTSSSIVTTVKNGATVQVLELGDTWTKIYADGATGYVMTKYLVIEQTEATPEPTASPEITAAPTGQPAAQTATVKLNSASSKLNVRKSATTTSSVVTTIRHGAVVDVLGTDGSWTNISVNGLTGYVMTKYLVMNEPQATVEPTATPEASVEPSVEPTAEPTAGPTQTPADAKVKLNSASSRLNVRKSASTSAAIVARVNHGATVQVLGTEGNWTKISTSGKTGYVMTKYLTIIDAEATPAPSATAEPTATATAEATTEPTATPLADATATAKVKLSSSSSKLNVRKSASTSSDIVAQLKHGATVQVLGVSGDWAKISTGGKIGYVMTKYLTAATAAPTAEPTATATTEPTAEPTATPVPTATAEAVTGTAKVKLSSSSSKLNVRASASTSSSVVTTVKHGATVQVLGVSGDWAKISTGGKIGYVMTKYLTKSDAAATAEPQATASPETAASATATPKPEETNETVIDEAAIKLSTTSTYVHLRQSDSTSSSSLAKLKHGTVVGVIGVSDGWAKIRVNGKTGYVMTKYLGKVGETTAATPKPETTAAPEEKATVEPTAAPTKKANGGLGSYDILYTATITEAVTLLSEANKDASGVADMEVGDEVQVVDTNGTWSYVVYGKFEGFILNEYLKK